MISILRAGDDDRHNAQSAEQKEQRGDDVSNPFHVRRCWVLPCGVIWKGFESATADRVVSASPAGFRSYDLGSWRGGIVKHPILDALVHLGAFLSD
jgi:hypothetical protein